MIDFEDLLGGSERRSLHTASMDLSMHRAPPKAAEFPELLGVSPTELGRLGSIPSADCRQYASARPRLFSRCRTRGVSVWSPHDPPPNRQRRGRGLERSWHNQSHTTRRRGNLGSKRVLTRYGRRDPPEIPLPGGRGTLGSGFQQARAHKAVPDSGSCRRDGNAKFGTRSRGWLSGGSVVCGQRLRVPSAPSDSSLFEPVPTSAAVRGWSFKPPAQACS